jgi:hypothetical protein
LLLLPLLLLPRLLLPLLLLPRLLLLLSAASLTRSGMCQAP